MVSTQWPGPPDAILDTGRYRLAELISTGTEARIRMVSPLGSPTGVQITREARIATGTSRLNLCLTFSNIGERPVRWSIWDVVQLRADRLRARRPPDLRTRLRRHCAG